MARNISGDGEINPSLITSSILTSEGQVIAPSQNTTIPVTFLRGWYQEAYIKAVNNDSYDNFSVSISLHSDTLVVGAKREDSAQTTITSGASAIPDNSNTDSGAVYVYKRAGHLWQQEAYIKAANCNNSDLFGSAVSLHKNTLAVSATHEDSNQITITNGATASTNNALGQSGAIYVYQRTGSTWTQEAYIKAANASTNDNLGSTISINNDTLVVGSNFEDGGESTITNGSTINEPSFLINSGAVYVYKRTGNLWEQEAYIKASNNRTVLYFGVEVSIDRDTIAVGVNGDNNNETTITHGTSSSTNTSSANSGAVFVYRRTGSTWAQEAYIKAINSNSSDSFGAHVSLNGDRLAVASVGEGCNLTTITNGNTASDNNSNSNSGAVYIYRRNGVFWEQEAYIKASNNLFYHSFGDSVSIQGNTLAIGARYEPSNQTTITNGATSSSNTTNFDSGAVYVYRRDGVTWVQEAYIKAANNDIYSYLGGGLSIFGDTIAATVLGDDSNQTSITNGETASTNKSSAQSGAVFVYRNRSRLFEVADLEATTTTDQINLSWVRPGGSATGFKVAYELGSIPIDCNSGTEVIVGDVDSFLITGVVGSTSYGVRVCSIDDDNVSEGSSIFLQTL